MIKMFYATEKTNSFRPEPWHWSEEPFPAFRGTGQRHKAFMAVAGGFKPWFNTFNLADNKAMSDDFCKVITTKKGTKLIVPCNAKEDERIVFVTARGGFRGGWGRIEVVGGDLIYLSDQTYACMHCCPVAHIVARITDPEGYVITETGRRCSRGDIEIYSWKGGYFRMDAEEYKAALETGTLFATRNTIQGDLERCKEKRAVEAESRRARTGFLTRLEAVNKTLAELDRAQYTLGETYFSRDDRSFLFTEENVIEAEGVAERAIESKRQVDAYAEWKPRFLQAIDEAVPGYPNIDSIWSNPFPGFCAVVYTNIYSVKVNGKSYSIQYSAEGYQELLSLLPEMKAGLEVEIAKKAKAEAEAKAKAEAEAEEARRKAEAEARKAKAEAEARALGLPSDIRLWHRSGATNAGQAWVIDAKGMDRECDEVDTMVCGSNSKRYHQNYEGDHVWHQILPGELVIYWAHAYTPAPHEFSVIYRPETLTEAQCERVAEIQQELEEQFFGKSGLTGTRSCPSIGKGWGLF